MEYSAGVVTEWGRHSKGLVTEWGPPNGWVLQDVRSSSTVDNRSQYFKQRMQHVPAWYLLRVEIWWKFPLGARWYEGDQWSFGDYFWCREWADIPIVFQRFWATAGLYEIVSFSEERFIWTEMEGWETEDHV